jgi:hypothetical protein
MRKPRAFNSVEEAIRHTAQPIGAGCPGWRYPSSHGRVRRAAHGGCGFTSETFAYEAVASWGDSTRYYYVYYFGDFDRPGVGFALLGREAKAILCRPSVSGDIQAHGDNAGTSLDCRHATRSGSRMLTKNGRIKSVLRMRDG